MLSLLFNVRRNKYLDLYEKYKNAKLEQSTSGKIYHIDINDEFAKRLNNYTTIDK